MLRSFTYAAEPAQVDFGEEWADRAIDLTAGKYFALAGASFALDKSARNAAASIGVLAIVNGKREKIDSLARLGTDDRAEDDRIAVLHRHGAAGELGVSPGFDG